MGLKEKWKEGYEREMAKEKEKLRQNEEKQNNMSESDKFAKNANFVLKGISFWILLPVFGVILIMLTFAGFWVWDQIQGLFA